MTTMTTIYYKKIYRAVSSPFNKEEAMPALLGATANLIYSELQGKDAVTIANEIAKQCGMLIQNFENDYFLVSALDEK